MDTAFLKESYKTAEGIIHPVGYRISALAAHINYKKTGVIGDFVCPECQAPVTFSKKNSDLSSLRPNEKRPYFYEKSAQNKHTCYPNGRLREDAHQNPQGKYQPNSKTNYYSKLIAPPSPSLSSESSEEDRSIMEKKNREDSYTTSHMDSICDTLERITKNFQSIQNPEQNKDKNEFLSKHSLSLPGNPKSDYYKGFRYVNSKQIPGRTRIYKGFVSSSFNCRDGFVVCFVFSTKYDSDAKPVFAHISAPNAELEQRLSNEEYLRENNFCFLFGKLEKFDAYCVIKLAHPSWISFRVSDKSGRNQTKKTHSKKPFSCEQITKKVAADLLAKHNTTPIEESPVLNEVNPITVNDNATDFNHKSQELQARESNKAMTLSHTTLAANEEIPIIVKEKHDELNQKGREIIRMNNALFISPPKDVAPLNTPIIHPPSPDLKTKRQSLAKKLWRWIYG